MLAQLRNPTPALIDRVTGRLDDGEPFQTFGMGFAFLADPTLELGGEPGQPPRWYPLGDTPPRASLRHWRRMADYAARFRPLP